MSSASSLQRFTSSVISLLHHLDLVRLLSPTLVKSFFLCVLLKVSVCVSLSLLCFVFTWTLAWFPFVAEPLEHLNGFELCPFFLWLLLGLRVFLEVFKKRKGSNLNTFNILLVFKGHCGI